MEKEFVVIRDTKEKLEVIGKCANITTVKNSKGQQYNIPNNYLVSYDTYMMLKDNFNKNK